MDLLARREHSVQELFEKLSRKFSDEQRYSLLTIHSYIVNSHAANSKASNNLAISTNEHTTNTPSHAAAAICRASEIKNNSALPDIRPLTLSQPHQPQPHQPPTVDVNTDSGLFEQQLSAQEVSTAELLESLTDAIYQQIESLRAENLQSDARFVESFINGRKATGKGPLRIKRELEQKGVSHKLLAQYLNESDNVWYALAEQVYTKKYINQYTFLRETMARGVNLDQNVHEDSTVREDIAEPLSYEERTKRLRFMQYRGFSMAMIQPLLE